MQRLVNGAVEHVRAPLALLQSDDLWMEAMAASDCWTADSALWINGVMSEDPLKDTVTWRSVPNNLFSLCSKVFLCTSSAIAAVSVWLSHWVQSEAWSFIESEVNMLICLSVSSSNVTIISVFTNCRRASERVPHYIFSLVYPSPFRWMTAAAQRGSCSFLPSRVKLANLQARLCLL